MHERSPRIGCRVTIGNSNCVEKRGGRREQAKKILEGP